MTELALRAVIKGTGSALPKRIVTNAELAAQVVQECCLQLKE